MSPTTQDLDPSVLEGLRTIEHGSELVDEVIAEYLHYTPSALQGLERAVQTGDFSKVQQTSHALKSSSGYVGATRMHELARDLEFMARDENLSEGQAVVGALMNAFEAVKKLLEPADQA